MLQGILFVVHTGISWERLPQELGFGSGMTCWRRLAAAGLPDQGCQKRHAYAGDLVGDSIEEAADGTQAASEAALPPSRRCARHGRILRTNVWSVVAMNTENAGPTD